MIKEFIIKLGKWVIPAKDKLEHYYLWSMAFFVIIYAFDLIESLTGFYISDWYAFGVVVYTALWKELYHDLYCKKGNAELKDFIAGIAIASFYMFKNK
tara:strand:- start:247 stop:540 length:294 start_codon:yes stop_codon:yes gene_type:complete